MLRFCPDYEVYANFIGFCKISAVCRIVPKGKIMKNAILILTLVLFSTLAIAKNFTLSDDDLMLLDWHLHDYSTAEVISKTDVEGSGVEFEIRFPDTNGPGRSIGYVSSTKGGEGLLTGIDISEYDAFSLKFTLVSVNDSNSPDAAGPLAIGALISIPRSWAYHPERVSLKPQRNGVISTTTTDANDISVIGFTAYLFTPVGWDPNGSTIKLLVEAAPNAEILP